MQRNFIRENSLIFIAIVLIMLSSAFDFRAAHDAAYEFIAPTDFEAHDSNYDRYKAIKDSMVAIDQALEWELSNLGTSMLAGPFGYSIMKDKSFLVLTNYRIHNNANFFLKDGRYFIEYSVPDDKKGDPWQRHNETKEVHVRYAKNYFSQPGMAQITPGYLLIPLNKSSFKVLKIVTIILYALIAVLTLYITLRVFLVTLWRIAKGELFTRRNLNNFQITAYWFIAVGLGQNLLQVIFYWMFSKKIPSEIYLPFPETLLQNKLVIINGLALLLIARAFRRGYELERQKVSPFT